MGCASHASPSPRLPFNQQYKLCRVQKRSIGNKGVPYLTTHDGRTIRYPDPTVKVNDSIMLDLATSTIKDVAKFDVGNLVMITRGHNAGRVGVLQSREKHKGSFDICHIKDSAGNEFATRGGNVFIIGKGSKALVSLPKRKGIKLTIIQEAKNRVGGELTQA